MKHHIPNFVTLLNLISGLLGLVFLLLNKPILAAIMIFSASFFDFLDGFVARLLHATSPMGKELDSLCDMLSFGVLPGFLVFYYLNDQHFLSVVNLYAFVGFLLPVFAALRLAKFNIDLNQKTSFMGVPVPLSAWFFASIPLIFNEYSVSWILSPTFLIISTVVFSYLMVSTIPVMSMKFSDYSWANNKARYFLIFISILSFVLIHFAAIPVIIIICLMLSQFYTKKA